MDKEDRNSIYDLENMRINIMDNNYLVSDLVDIKIERDLLSIDHLNGKRSVQIDADLLNPKLDNPITITANIEEYINSNIKSIYPSIKHSVEGQIRSQAETGKSLGFSSDLTSFLDNVSSATEGSPSSFFSEVGFNHPSNTPFNSS